MRAAVAGGGIFGCVTALELARAGIEVDLFEHRANLLLGASGHNQGRLHAGYHYPRSLATVREVRDQLYAWGARFPGAVNCDSAHHYVVAKGGLTGGRGFLAFCKQAQLHYSEVTHRLVRRDTTDATVRVAGEAFVDLPALRTILHRELADAGVRVKFNAPVIPQGLTYSYDWVVDATYGAHSSRPLRYEVCEIALVELGRSFATQSFVVLDGPFVSLDPLVGTDLHMLYDVHHSVHHAAEGHEVELPDAYVNLVGQGPKHTPLTRVDAMRQTARRFFLGIGMPSYRGSLFTVRAVLPDVDATDERPTLVERDGNLITVLSGKIVTALSAAQRVVDLVREEVPVA